MKRSTTLPFAGIPALLLLAAFAPGTAQAYVISASPAIPPLGPPGYNMTSPGITYFVTGVGPVILTGLKLINTGFISSTPIGANELDRFSASLTGFGAAPGIGLPATPSSSAGTSDMLFFGKVGNVTGTFNTEMLSLNLNGVIPGAGAFMIRESPTLQSLGVTSVAGIGGGQFRIDSFFDVFTELSIDGGATWSPATSGPAHFDLGPPVPEPGAGLLTVLCATGLMLRRRRA